MRTLVKRLILLAILAVFAIPFMAAGSCDGTDLAQQAEQAANQRADNFSRAQKLYPAPNNQNFPLREALVQFTQPQDLTNHPWYVYVFPPYGSQPIGYYVAKAVPQNICNFLSSSQGKGDGYQAPSLDGIFYGGSGASNGCDAVFFFDYATNALIQIGKLGYFTADQPLNLDVPQLGVKQ